VSQVFEDFYKNMIPHLFSFVLHLKINEEAYFCKNPQKLGSQFYRIIFCMLRKNSQFPETAHTPIFSIFYKHTGNENG